MKDLVTTQLVEKTLWDLVQKIVEQVGSSFDWEDNKFMRDAVRNTLEGKASVLFLSEVTYEIAAASIGELDQNKLKYFKSKETFKHVYKTKVNNYEVH